jgi:hypothetical protein
MIAITCNSCHKPLSIDETKLPMKEVSFPCPVCGERLTVDRRTLLPPRPVSIPDDALEVIRQCLVVGIDDPAVTEASAALGYQARHFASPVDARDYFLQEFPALIILRPAEMTAPPLATMLPVTAMNPMDRRRAFIILVSENLRTFDGNAAFLYGVNLVVAVKDLGAIRQIYREAEMHHRRLYLGMMDLEKAG